MRENVQKEIYNIERIFLSKSICIFIRFLFEL